MLVSKSFAANDVLTIRLTSGEEIIGRFVSQTDTTITLAKVIAIQLHMVAPGQAGIAFAPFLASVDDDGNTDFYKSALVIPPHKTRADVSSKYTEATSSIAIPTPQQASTLLRP